MYSAARAAAASRRIQMCPCFSCREPPRQPPRVLKLRHTNDHRRCLSDCDRAPPRPALDTAQSGQARRCKSKTMLFFVFFHFFLRTLQSCLGFLSVLAQNSFACAKLMGSFIAGYTESPPHHILYSENWSSSVIQLSPQAWQQSMCFFCRTWINMDRPFSTINCWDLSSK